jgi:hypothetical protein
LIIDYAKGQIIDEGSIVQQVSCGVTTSGELLTINIFATKPEEIESALSYINTIHR